MKEYFNENTKPPVLASGDFREFPKVCVNLYTDVRYTYQYGGFIYG